MAKLNYSNKRIWYTRPFNQIDSIKDALIDEGALLCHIPLIKLSLSHDLKVDTDMCKLNGKSWVLLASPTAAHFFLKKWNQLKIKASFKIACVGLKTASLVEKSGYLVSFVPPEANMQSMCRQLPFIKGEKIYYFGVSLTGNEENFEILHQRGAQMNVSKLYNNKALELDKENKLRLNEKRPDYIVVTSYSSIDALKLAINQLKWPILECPLLSIGPLTSKYAKEMGFTEIYTAESPSAEGFINAY